MSNPGVIYWSEQLRLSVKIREKALSDNGDELLADAFKELAEAIADTNERILKEEVDK